MAGKVRKIVKGAASKVNTSFKGVLSSLPCIGRSTEPPSGGSGVPDADPEKEHVPLVERVNDISTTVNIRRKPIASGVLPNRRDSASLDINRDDPILPPELIEKIASFMTQTELLKFSKLSRTTYTAAERHLYRRPSTRRFDRLLRTLEMSPYKADFILELAFGFETDFYSVKGPCYDREVVYSAILSRTRNLQQLIYQGSLQWTVTPPQPFAARHAYIITVPSHVQTGSIPVELLNNIPSTLKHLQFRRVYGKYNHICEVIRRNDHLESLNLYEIGNLESLHLEKLINLPVAKNLKALRLRHLPHHVEIDHGALVARTLPHLISLRTLTVEISSLEDEPFFSTFIRCKNIRNFKFGYSDRVTLEGLSQLARHGELRTLEFMPCVVLDIDTLRTIIDGNTHLCSLLLPKEAVSEKREKALLYICARNLTDDRSLLIGNDTRVYIKPPSREFELSMRQRLSRPPVMQIIW